MVCVKEEEGRMSVTLSAVSIGYISWRGSPQHPLWGCEPLLWHNSQSQKWATGHGVWREEGELGTGSAQPIIQMIFMIHGKIKSPAADT